MDDNDDIAVVEGDGESVEDGDEEEDVELDQVWDEFDIQTEEENVRRRHDVLPRVQKAWTDFMEDTDGCLNLQWMEFTSYFVFTFLEGLLRHEARKSSPNPTPHLVFTFLEGLLHLVFTFLEGLLRHESQKPSPKPIHQLRMAYNTFSDQEAFDSFLWFLQQINPNELKEIEWSLIEFGPDRDVLSERQLLSFLSIASRFRSLEHLSLTRSKIGQHVGQVLCDLIQGLFKLELCGCRIESTVMHEICALLALPRCTVRHLSLDHHEFSDHEFQEFLNTLQSHPGIQSLSLNGIQIGPEFISDSRLEQLIEALNATETEARCSTLSLGMNYNLSHRSLPLVNGILASWTGLREITLWQTEILRNFDPSDTAFLDFIEALRNNTRLQVLRLSLDPMSDKQVSALLQTLESNTTLQTLELWGSGDITEAVIQNLPRIKGLRSFIFHEDEDEDNSINLGSDRLRNALFQNTSLVKLAPGDDTPPGERLAHIFQRNKLIRRCDHFLLNGHHLNAQNISFCVERLMSNDCPNPSALYKFLTVAVPVLAVAQSNSSE